MASAEYQKAKGLASFITNGLWVCLPSVALALSCRSDGDDGPDDGTNHVHPERVFHDDLVRAGLLAFDFD